MLRSIYMYHNGYNIIMRLHNVHVQSVYKYIQLYIVVLTSNAASSIKSFDGMIKIITTYQTMVSVHVKTVLWTAKTVLD